MDGEANTVQQVPGQLVDTGPMPLDVLEAEMTLQLRGAIDLETQLREQLATMAPNAHTQARVRLLRSLMRDRSVDL
jgi:hypothetical protein